MCSSDLDRAPMRAGETVSMKHYMRLSVGSQNSTLVLPPAQEMAGRLVITHVGSGQEFEQSVQWQDTPTGGRSATSEFKVPKGAKLGLYSIKLIGRYEMNTGSFRVEEFRLPVYRGSVAVADKNALIATTDVPVQVEVGYVAGGAAAHLPVQVSAAVRETQPS